MFDDANENHGDYEGRSWGEYDYGEYGGVDANTEPSPSDTDPTKLSFVIKFGAEDAIVRAKEVEEEDRKSENSLERPRTLSAKLGDDGSRDVISSIVQRLLGGSGSRDLELNINGKEFRTRIVSLDEKEEEEKHKATTNQRIDLGSSEERLTTEASESSPSVTTYGYKIKDKIGYRSKIRLNPGEGGEDRQGKDFVADSHPSAAVFINSAPEEPPPRPPPLPTAAPFFAHRTTALPSYGVTVTPTKAPPYSFSTRPPYFHTTLPPFRRHHYRPPPTVTPAPRPTYSSTLLPITAPVDNNKPSEHRKKLRVIHVSPRPPIPPPASAPFVFDLHPNKGGGGKSKKSSYVFQSMGHGPASTSFAYDLDNGKVTSYTGDHIVGPHQVHLSRLKGRKISRNYLVKYFFVGGKKTSTT